MLAAAAAFDCGLRRVVNARWGRMYWLSVEPWVPRMRNETGTVEQVRVG